MKTKRITTIVLSALLAIGLSGCGGKKGNTEIADTTEMITEVPSTEAISTTEAVTEISTTEEITITEIEDEEPAWTSQTFQDLSFQVPADWTYNSDAEESKDTWMSCEYDYENGWTYIDRTDITGYTAEDHFNNLLDGLTAEGEYQVYLDKTERRSVAGEYGHYAKGSVTTASGIDYEVYIVCFQIDNYCYIFNMNWKKDSATPAPFDDLIDSVKPL